MRPLLHTAVRPPSPMNQRANVNHSTKPQSSEDGCGPIFSACSKWQAFNYDHLLVFSGLFFVAGVVGSLCIWLGGLTPLGFYGVVVAVGFSIIMLWAGLNASREVNPEEFSARVGMKCEGHPDLWQLAGDVATEQGGQLWGYQLSLLDNELARREARAKVKAPY